MRTENWPLLLAMRMSLVTSKRTFVVYCWKKHPTGVFSRENYKREIGDNEKRLLFQEVLLNGKKMWWQLEKNVESVWGFNGGNIKHLHANRNGPVDQGLFPTFVTISSQSPFLSPVPTPWLLNIGLAQVSVLGYLFFHLLTNFLGDLLQTHGIYMMIAPKFISPTHSLPWTLDSYIQFCFQHHFLNV